jgi:hypothetical protein
MSTLPSYDPGHPLVVTESSVRNDPEKIPSIESTNDSEAISTAAKSTPNEDDVRKLRRVAGKVPYPAYMLAFLETVSSVAISGAGIIGTYVLINIYHL